MGGERVLCPPATSLDFRVNLPSIVIPKIMCVATYLNPGFTFLYIICSDVTRFRTLKATRTLAIYFLIEFFQKVVPRLLINVICLINRLRNLNPKLMCCSLVFCFEL